MEYTKNMRFPKPGYDDAADIGIITSSFDKIEDAAGVWNSFSNFGNAVLEGEKNITITPKLPIYSSIFAITFKAPKTFEEGDTITINDAVYNMMEGSDPALNEAFVKDEVITMNFDDSRRLCWSSAGGGAPRELPAQISGMTATVIEGSTPTVRFTWNNPNDKNFAGMVLLVKEGSAPNSPTDGTEVFRGTSESYTYTATNWERTYYARGFAYNSQRKYQLDAQGAIASAKPSKIPPVCLDLTATPDGDTCKITWFVQNSMYLDKVVLVQKIGSAPASPTDGTKLYEGTAEEFTATNLQNGVHYFWTIFALNVTGEYLAPAKSVDYTPKLLPNYNYSGESQLLADEGGNWRIKFLTSGVLEWLSNDAYIDVFLVGGGGGGGCGGGGGGYTSTARKIQLNKNQQVRITVGAGGLGGQASLSYIRAGYEGGSSSFGELTVNGGKPGQCNGSVDGHGGNGGSGGGGFGGPWSGGLVSIKGDGGSDGKSGISVQYYSDGYKYSYGGTGQGTTTREFGEATGELYSGGGGGGLDQGHPTRPGSGDGGDGGYGGGKGKTPRVAGPGDDAVNGIGGRGGFASEMGSDYESAGGGGGGGYGGGGGGGARTRQSSIDNTRYGKGYQGIVIIRNAR